MNDFLKTKTPLSYQEWIARLGYNADISQNAYFIYLNSWYRQNKGIYALDDPAPTMRAQYIQLIKDLLYLFNEEEKRDLFLQDIDFNNDEDLIYIIPYLASKLKQISQLISQKREELKKKKNKDVLVGSDLGLEKIIYEYILKNFTSKPFQWTRIPISPLANEFPQLSSISEDFFIEIEELYETEKNYHDSDPTVPIEEYLNIDSIIQQQPYEDLTDDELATLITSRFLEKIAPTPLSEVYNQYLTFTNEASASLFSELSASYQTSVLNQIAANQSYLGEHIYALTAVRNDEENQADFVLNLPFENGYNWFYWPSGDKGPDPTIIGNTYSPIPINESNLLLNRTVTGSNHLNSDLFFANKDGVLEGAWLQGYREMTTEGQMNVTLISNDKTEFIFPWVGFDIDSKNLSFKGYTLNDFSQVTYQKLSPALRSAILNSYFNGVLPNSAVYDVYLNQTNLVYAGANAGYMSDNADTISVTPTGAIFFVWNEKTQGKVNEAYLYKFIKTDIYIKNDLNDIHWPIQSFEGGFDNITLTLSADTCLPIVLGGLEPSKSMIGAVAGRTLSEADVIYKLADNGGEPIEAAWLGSGTISQIDQARNAIAVYQTSAINCAQYIDGPIQPSLYAKFEPGIFTSFVWMDEDTPADEVFKYQQHATTCPFGQTFPHNFYNNQEYQNPSPLNEGKYFPLKRYPCTCGAVNYSPIGHQGTFPTDYNGMADMLFADPQGLGGNYTYNGYRDTRDLAPNNSPQFSFYKIDGRLDKEVGFGTGKWETGNGSRMILKSGRRYTYYRSNLRINSNSDSDIKSPYLFAKYGYKNIQVTCGPFYSNLVDLVILIDNSRTQFYSLKDVKEWAKKVCETSLSGNQDCQIAIVSFARDGLVLNYLSNELSYLYEAIDSIKYYSDLKDYPLWLTNITEGLILANNVLFTTQPPENECNFGDISKLCSGLTSQILNQSKIGTLTNCPRANAAKKILLFSDGQETFNEGTAGPYSRAIKNNDVEITCIDIGHFSVKNSLMEEMASPNMYFNLQEYILYGDIDVDRFFSNISTLLMGCFPAIPVWCKAFKDSSGNWVGMNIPSDMVLEPGDYLAYVHRPQTRYVSQNTDSNFTIPSLSFTINVKLDGWDYYTNTFSVCSRGDSYGGKPFWGKISFPSASAIPFGGSARLMDDYVILHQPEVSDMVLKNGSYVRYNNIGKEFFVWKEDLLFNSHYNDQIWKKLKLTKRTSNLSNYLNTINIEDYDIESTNENSDIFLESYSTLNATKYLYYLAPFHDPYLYSEKLYYINRCSGSYVIFTSGKALDAVQPHLNLDNIFYPTVANINFPSKFVSEKQTGNYLLPSRLGVPYYRGVNYNIELDPTKVEYIKSQNKDLLFADPLKYGPRNRGLTKKDQLAPLKIKNIDNSWFMAPYVANQFQGIITDTLRNQKLIPYQSNYEIDTSNQFGLCLQKDDFQFWNVDYYNNWTNKSNYPLTLRNELIIKNYINRLDALIVDIGIQDEWKTDIYGNNFGLFKSYGEEKTRYILSENEEIFTTETGLRFVTEFDYLGIDFTRTNPCILIAELFLRGLWEGEIPDFCIEEGIIPPDTGGGGQNPL